MEVSAQQVLEILNKRARTEPLIQEIMRSAMFEAAYLAEATDQIRGDDAPVDTDTPTETAEL